MPALCKPKLLILCAVFTRLRSTMAYASGHRRLPFTCAVGRKEIPGLGYRAVCGLPGRKQITFVYLCSRGLGCVHASRQT